MCQEQKEIYINLSPRNGDTHFKFSLILTLLVRKAYIIDISPPDFNKLGQTNHLAYVWSMN